MAANSAIRKLLKRVLFPIFNERTYRYFQAVAMAWDIRSGKFTEPELDLVPFALREGETALDIGANYGVYSYHCSRAVGRNGRVYAFEPVPFTCDTLRLIAKLLRFRNVEIVPKGCSDRNGKISFTVPVQASGAMSAGQAHISGRNDDHEGKEKQVRWNSTREIEGEVVALDEFLPHLSNLSLIKCDIEGAELLAFRGAEKIIDEFHPSVICEINPWFLDGFGLQLEDLIQFFFQKEYALYLYTNDGVRELRQVADLSNIVEDNYVFIHPQRLSRFALLLK
jgi:FkbM family methyltransferase